MLVVAAEDLRTTFMCFAGFGSREVSTRALKCSDHRQCALLLKHMPSQHTTHNTQTKTALPHMRIAAVE